MKQDQLSINSTVRPTSTTGLFRFQPQKIEVGALYFYIKSNLDGSKPAKIFMFVASETHIEVLKVEPGDEILSLVTADMNWATYSADLLESWYVLPESEYQGHLIPAPGMLITQAYGAHSYKNHVFYMWYNGGCGQASVEHYPFHVYNFDFLSLNFIFRHLVDPEQDFEIGVVDPNWEVVKTLGNAEAGEEPNILEYRGKALVEFLGEEPYHRIACRKYRISGPGMKNMQGFIWVDREKGHFVNFEHPLFDNPNWNSFKLELQSSDTLSEGEWMAFMAGEREKNVQLLRATKKIRSGSTTAIPGPPVS